MHHVDGAGACRGVAHNEGDQGGVHLGHVVSPHTEEYVLTELLPVLHSVADLLGQGADQPAAGHELVQADLLEQPAEGTWVVGQHSEYFGWEVWDSCVGTVANHQPGAGAQPGLVVAGREVGESAHAVPDVEVLLHLTVQYSTVQYSTVQYSTVLLHLRHGHHVAHHGGQVVLRVLVPGEAPVGSLLYGPVDVSPAVGVPPEVS